jgi:hypothetical protein
MSANRNSRLVVPILALGLSACGIPDPAEGQGIASSLTYPDPTVIAATLVSPPSNLSASNIYSQFNAPAHGNWYAGVRWMGDAQSNGNSIDCGGPSNELTQEVANSVTWNPVQFTGLDCSAFGCNGTYQKGRYNDGVNASGVFQAHGADFGSFINTWYFLHRRNIPGGGPHSVLTYDLLTPAAIYTHPGNSTDSLFVQGSVQIPLSSEWSGAVGQYSLAGYLQDSVSGKVIEFLAFLYDNRGLPTNSYLSSSNGQSYWAVPFSSYSPVASNGKSYGHPSGFSALGGSSQYSTAKFFRFNLTQSELINVVTDLNAQYGLGLSTTATNYRLTGLHTLHEVFPLAQDSATSDCLPTGSSGITKAAGQVSMGTNTSSFAAYEAY